MEEFTVLPTFPNPCKILIRGKDVNRVPEGEGSGGTGQKLCSGDLALEFYLCVLGSCS